MCFNEAAGIHQRKHEGHPVYQRGAERASMRPPEFTGGNFEESGIHVIECTDASMRPPEFTGGNDREWVGAVAQDLASMRPPEFTGGNAAHLHGQAVADRRASMRPPEFTGGNLSRSWRLPANGKTASMRPPEFTGGNGAPDRAPTHLRLQAFQ